MTRVRGNQWNGHYSREIGSKKYAGGRLFFLAWAFETIVFYENVPLHVWSL